MTNEVMPRRYTEGDLEERDSEPDLQGMYMLAL